MKVRVIEMFSCRARTTSCRKRNGKTDGATCTSLMNPTCIAECPHAVPNSLLLINAACLQELLSWDLLNFPPHHAHVRCSQLPAPSFQLQSPSASWLLFPFRPYGHQGNFVPRFVYAIIPPLFILLEKGA